MAVSSKKSKTVKAAPAPYTRMTRSRTRAGADAVKADTSSVTRSVLENLPFEILHAVCEYVAGPRSSNLFALSQTSKRCLAASSPLLFREITFCAISRQKLQEDVDQYRTILDSRASWMHVRQVSIEGGLWLSDQDDEDLEEDVEDFVLQRERDTELRLREERRTELEESGEFATPQDHHRRDSCSPRNAYDKDYAWKPLAEMLKHLTGLADLRYDCHEQLPPCLLQALHQDLPSCRLHMGSLQLHSFWKTHLDPHEKALVTSPSLHTAALGLDPTVPGELDYTIYSAEQRHWDVESLLAMVAGAAPNLKNVCLSGYTKCMPPSLIKSIGEPEHAQPLLHPQESPRLTRTGSLASLTLCSVSLERVDRVDLVVWNRYTDFSALRLLKLVKVETDALGWAAANCTFSSVRTLVLRLDDEEFERLKFAERPQVTDFLYSLPQLTNLDISGGVSLGIFRTCVERSAPTLKRLWVADVEGWSNEVYVPDMVEILRKNPLPLLEDLSLSISQSSPGQDDKAAIQRAVGTSPRLRRCRLT